MNVNYQNTEKKINQIIKEQHGMLFSSDLDAHDIPRAYLSILEQKGEINKVSRGVYVEKNAIIDEMLSFQNRYQKTIFSHETALYLHNLTDRSPLFFSVTVPSGYNATALKKAGNKVFFINPKNHLLGIEPLKTPNGNEVNGYNLERTMCDLVRNRNQLDDQILFEAFKEYVKRKEKNLNQLHQYAKFFKVQSILRGYIEILL